MDDTTPTSTRWSPWRSAATGRLRAYVEANLAQLRTHRLEMATLLALRLGPEPGVRGVGARIHTTVLGLYLPHDAA